MNLLSEGPLTENETLELENIIYELIGEDGQLGDPYTLTTVDSAILLLKLEACWGPDLGILPRR